jgi:hypothetical protein
MIRILVVSLVLLSSAAARADEAAARKSFEAGERAYNLGEFDKAVELFRKAFEEWPEPAFLFNLAQTYRQAGDCKQAAFFYKRFLALKEDDTKKPLRAELKQEVEKRIVELEECVKREIASKPPTALDRGTNAATGTPATGTPGKTSPTGGTPTNANTNTETANTEAGGEGEGEDEEAAEVVAHADGKPTLVSARVGLGAAKLSAGDLITPIQFAGTLVGGYPLALGDKLQLDLGAALSFTPVPYDATQGASVMKGTGVLFGILANVSPAVTVIPKLAIRADVGAGVLVFSGLGLMGNPFTENGNPATGGLTAFMLRTALSADYAVTSNLLLTVTPIAFAYSPAPTGFTSTISSLTTVSFLAGVGYRR